VKAQMLRLTVTSKMHCFQLSKGIARCPFLCAFLLIVAAYLLFIQLTKVKTQKNHSKQVGRKYEYKNKIRAVIVSTPAKSVAGDGKKDKSANFSYAHFSFTAV